MSEAGRGSRTGPLAALPPGSMTVGLGLVVNGGATYAALAAVNRSVDAAGYGHFAVLWALVFTLGPGLFQPLEQVLARQTAERAVRGEGSAPVLAQAARIGGLFLAGVVAVLVAAWPLGLDGLLGGRLGLLWVLLATLAAFAVVDLVRGVLGGKKRFVAYGRSLAAEGGGRFGVALLLALLGVTSVSWFGLALVVSLVVGSVAGLPRGERLVHAGPPLARNQLTGAFGLLLVSSLLESSLLNVGPVAVQALSPDDADAGLFLNGLIVARVPLFLFTAIKIALLPSLAEHASRRDMDAFARVIGRLLAAVGVLIVVGTGGAYLVGPWVVEFLFTDSLPGLDMALLGLASGGAMLVLALAVALISLGLDRHVAVGWVLGLVGLLGVLSTNLDVFRRVELALIASVAVSAAAMGRSLRRALHPR